MLVLLIAVTIILTILILLLGPSLVDLMRIELYGLSVPGAVGLRPVQLNRSVA